MRSMAFLAVGSLAAVAPSIPWAQASAAPGHPAAVAARQPSRPAGTRHTLRPPAAPRLPADQRRVCAAPVASGQMQCQSVLQLPGPHAASGFVSPAATIHGFGPKLLRRAYALTSAATGRGRGETIAIVDAFSDPRAAHDLAAYRQHYHLPSCTTGSGCLRIVNQSGHTGPLPKPNSGWAVEESLDLDMVSAICERCHILLVEATNNLIVNLGKAEDTAVAKGARFVSNSWSGSEFIGQDSDNPFFNHSGDAIVFASGDFGIGAEYPTDTQYVTSVGGTTLRQSSGGRGWTERVWGSTSSDRNGGTGSGCSSLEVKPSWQGADATSPKGCLNRTENDVAAVANPSTGVAVYDTYRTGGTWGELGGTSVATPIITSVYALAGTPPRASYPAAFPYQHLAGRFYDPSSGINGTCESQRLYLCHGEHGYDGPTGRGTPHGTGGFSRLTSRALAVLDPGTQDTATGGSLSLTIHAVDASKRARPLAYSASGLPAGLSVSGSPTSSNGLISGTLPAVPGTFGVTVTATDRQTGQSSQTRFTINVLPSMTAPAGDLVQAHVVANERGLGGSACLSAASISAGAHAETDFCDDSQVSQQWEYLAGTAPGQPGELTPAPGICLGRSGNDAVLQSCNGSAGQGWTYEPAFSANEGETWLVSQQDGRCLNGGPLADGTKVVVSACSVASSAAGQDWTLPAGVVVSGVPGLCLSAAPASVAPCSLTTGQIWQSFAGALAGNSGCLAVTSALSGTKTGLAACGGAGTDARLTWLPGPGGELINAFSGKCLDDPGGAGSGTALVQEDCYGQPGEVWAFN
jgi:putative Ig domain-containing protein/ricin-type beta-trefoil lectin protein/subtilase family protein